MLQILPSHLSQAATAPIQPGAAIGVLGGGQLGRMFAQAAQRMGYRVHVYSPEPDSPAGEVAHREITAPFTDLLAVKEFAAAVDVVTLEFENVPLAAAEAAARHAPLRPSAQILHTVQHRLREKQFFVDSNVACTPFRPVRSRQDLDVAISQIGTPAVLKTAVAGYDGKGQVRIDSPADADAAWDQIGQAESVLEGFVDFEWELSILAARGLDGSLVTYGPMANTHDKHILDVTVLPHPALASIEEEARTLAATIAQRLELVGILCVEFFLTRDARLLANEIAPRPHNSGHLTIEACATSQFEQQVRAVCGMPLGSVAQLRPAAMANLLGELWADGEPHWSHALECDTVKLHLYGKREPRAGRKMGHLTALADSPQQAELLARTARDRLRG